MGITFATTIPLEMYTVEVDGEKYGLYESHGHDPALFALILLTSPVGYDYELMVKDPMEYKSRIDNIEPYTETLNCDVFGKKIRYMLEENDPLEMYYALQDRPDLVSVLPMVDGVFKGSVSHFLSMVGARAANWALERKGTVNKDRSRGKIIHIDFGKPSIPETLVELNKTFKEMWNER